MCFISFIHLFSITMQTRKEFYINLIFFSKFIDSKVEFSMYQKDYGPPQVKCWLLISSFFYAIVIENFPSKYQEYKNSRSKKKRTLLRKLPSINHGAVRNNYILHILTYYYGIRLEERKRGRSGSLNRFLSKSIPSATTITIQTTISPRSKNHRVPGESSQ